MSMVMVMSIIAFVPTDLSDATANIMSIRAGSIHVKTEELSKVLVLDTAAVNAHQE